MMRTVARKHKVAADAVLAADTITDDRLPFCEVSPHGYGWSGSRRARALMSLSDPSEQSRRYNPMEKGGLFLTFAGLEASESAFLTFADEFGLLGLPLVGAGLVGGERWDDWCYHRARLANTVRLWQCDSESEESDCLSGPERQADGRSVWVFHEAGRPDCDIQSATISDTRRERVAKWFVRQQVSMHLRRHVSVITMWHEKRRQPVLRVVPDNLLGAMWFQFARTICGEVQFRPCKQCNKPLPIGVDGFTSAKVFCSPACTQKDHRAKVKRAKELRAQGKPVAKIAKLMDTEPGSITNWLTKKK